MIPGYNHNIKHKGRTFHVQTEDSGPGTPMIMTHVFIGGNIIASKKQQYGDVVKLAEAEQLIKARMQGQHKEMLHNLVGGSYDDVVDKFVQSGALPPVDTKPDPEAATDAGWDDEAPVVAATLIEDEPDATAPSTEPSLPVPPPAGRAASANEPPRTTTAVGIQAPSRPLPERAQRRHRPALEGLPGPAASNVRVQPIGQPVPNDIEGLPPGAVPVTPPPIVVGKSGARGLGAAPPRRHTNKGFQKPDLPPAAAGGPATQRGSPTQPGADADRAATKIPTRTIRKPFGVEVITTRPLDEVILNFLSDDRGD